jgi:hypothetical protein
MPQTAEKPAPLKGPTEGSALFAAFLARNGISNVTASKALGVSDPTIHEWKNGTKRPIQARRDAIAVWTNGEVAAESWLYTNEKIPGAGVIPFEKPSRPGVDTEVDADKSDSFAVVTPERDTEVSVAPPATSSARAAGS